MNGAPWTSDQVGELRRLARKGWTDETIAARFSRTAAAVRERCRLLNITVARAQKKRIDWTERQERARVEAQRYIARCIAEHPMDHGAIRAFVEARKQSTGGQ
jgi:hypothetical protein